MFLVEGKSMKISSTLTPSFKRFYTRYKIKTAKGLLDLKPLNRGAVNIVFLIRNNSRIPYSFLAPGIPCALFISLLLVL